MIPGPAANDGCCGGPQIAGCMRLLRAMSAAAGGDANSREAARTAPAEQARLRKRARTPAVRRLLAVLLCGRLMDAAPLPEVSTSSGRTPPALHRRALRSSSSSNAANANTPVTETTDCPDGYFRNETVVFGCDPHSGQAYVIVVPSVEEDALILPAGTKNVKIGTQVHSGVSISVVDPSSGQYVVGALMRSAGSSELRWQNVTIAYDQGVVTFFGILEQDLVVRLEFDGGSSDGDGEVLVALTYSHDGRLASEGNCPEVPFGCSRYDDEATRRVVYQWSAWVKSEYATADLAWTRLCVSAMEAVTLEAAPASATSEMKRRRLLEGAVPYYIWKNVWLRWPAANLSYPGWQATFYLVDSLEIKDKYVEQSEFYKAYDLESVYPSMQLWCNSLHQHYASPAAAYKALAGSESDLGISVKRWQEKVWPNFSSPSWLVKAPASQGLDYMDTTDNRVISESELSALWSQCDEFNITTTSTSTMISPLLPQPSPAPTKENQTCCQEKVAECLACQEHLGISEYCKQYGIADVSGCEHGDTTAKPSLDVTAKPNLAAPTVPPKEEPLQPPGVQGACLREGAAYEPLLLGHDPAVLKGGVSECQAMCLGTLGCYRFTYWKANSTCTVHGNDATWVEAKGATISGPPRCIADVMLHIRGIEFLRLDADAKKFLKDRFVVALATATGVVYDAIRDLDGVDSSVTLEAGSLIAHALVVLAPGRTIASAAKSIGSPSVRKLLTLDILESNVSNDTTEEAIGVTVSHWKQGDCYLEGTKYEPSMPSYDLATGQDTVWAANMSACQARCQKTKGCIHFSYWMKYKGCLLQNSSGVAVKDPNVTAGPALCVPDPHYAEPSDRELKAPGETLDFKDWLLSHPEVIASVIIVVFVLPLVLVGVFWLWKHKKRRRRRGPNSRSGDPLYHAVKQDQEYSSMPLQNEEKASFGSHLERLRQDNVGTPPMRQGSAGTPPMRQSGDGSASTNRYAMSQSDAQASPFLRPEHLGVQNVGYAPQSPWMGQDHASAHAQHVQWYPAPAPM